MGKGDKTCDNIQCPLAPNCERYLPWEPCELDYEVGTDGAHCECYKPIKNKKPIQLELF